MSKRASPTMVGSFILGAIALVVAAVVIFGSSAWFRHRPRAVAFFEGNLQGLNVGAPVTLRGVPIGQVTAIKIDLNVDKMVATIPVYMEFYPEAMTFTEAGLTPEQVARQVVLKDAIAHGLHATLATQSLVTGQLLVNLSLDTNEPSRFVGADKSVVEIPTAPSEIERLKDYLSKLPLDKIAESLLRTSESIERLVSSPEIPALLQSLQAASVGLNELLAEVRADLKPVVANVNDTGQSTRETLTAARGTLKIADDVMNKNVRGALKAATAALETAQTTLSNTNNLIVNSQQRYDIDQTLRNLTATTRALRDFAEDLERKPNALIVGK
jgi:paraquat-inducible protein B